MEKNPRSTSQIKKTRFHVVCRIRPTDVGEEYTSGIFDKDELRKVVAKISDSELRVSKPLIEDKVFEFDKVLKYTATQVDSFNHIAKGLVYDVTEGYNGTIMAYGQTGSGKTYTIFGKSDSLDYNHDNGLDDHAGIVPRAVCYLFDKLRKESKKVKFKISVSFFQVYLEQITDLIPDLEEDENNNNSNNNYNSNINNKDKKKPMNFNNKESTNNSALIKQAKKDAGEGLKIREDPKTGVFIQGLKQLQVENEEQLLGLIKYATRNRITHNTNMNNASSRSHAILRILFEKRTYEKTKDKDKDNKGNYSTSKGLLTLVDLAGSEKSKLTNDGIRKEESKYINTSIYHLGTVVYNLANHNHVNFRETSLTRILKECLCGNSKTAICATVSPFLVNYEETITTLQFASQAKLIKVNATVNVQHEIKQMKDQLYNIVNNSQKNLNSNKLSFVSNHSGNNSNSNSNMINNLINSGIRGSNTSSSNRKGNSNKKGSYSSSPGDRLSNALNANLTGVRNSYGNSNKGYPGLSNNSLYNGDIVVEEDYQSINRKYFEMIAFLQGELCQKELEVFNLSKENKELKEKLSAYRGKSKK